MPGRSVIPRVVFDSGRRGETASRMNQLIATATTRIKTFMRVLCGVLYLTTVMIYHSVVFIPLEDVTEFIYFSSALIFLSSELAWEPVDATRSSAGWWLWSHLAA